MQPAIARSGIERDIGNVEIAQHFGDHVAAEARHIGARRNRPLHGGGIGRWRMAGRRYRTVDMKALSALTREKPIQADQEFSRNRARTLRPA